MTDATNLLPGLAERRQSVRGTQIRVFERGGSGPPLLLVHGFGGSAWNWSELVPLLHGRRLVIPDLPGHGRSHALPAASIAALADVLAELVDEPADVVGHSLGGPVALRLAERWPDRVRSLVLAAPAGISTTTRIAELTITLVGVVQPARLLGRGIDRVARSRRLKRLVFSELEVANADALGARAVHGLLRGPAIHMDALSAGLALAADDPRHDLARVRCPTLVLHGARDRQVPLADGFEYARRLRAPLRVIADCGHLLIAERPDACARAVLEHVG